MRRHRSFSVVSAGALSLGLVLAACGIEPQESGGGRRRGRQRRSGCRGRAALPARRRSAAGEPEENLEFANWPLYIDVDDEGNSPTIQQFEEATGVDINYTEAIEDNNSFFGTIQPPLAAGDDTGYDIIVVTDWMVGNMIRLGYLEPIDVERDVPNFLENTDAVYAERSYDPGNVYSVPYQSGITGIGYNPALVDEEITSWAQLSDPAFIEKYCGQIGMFVDARDAIGSAAALQRRRAGGRRPWRTWRRPSRCWSTRRPVCATTTATSTPRAWPMEASRITMAWSGDVFQLQFDNPDLTFVLPDEGGILWTDNMVIPKGAAHPNAALAMMDYLYDPEIAAQVAEYVNYITPVPGAKEIILQHAEEAESEEDAEYLRTVADSPLVFPTPDMLDRRVQLQGPRRRGGATVERAL